MSAYTSTRDTLSINGPAHTARSSSSRTAASAATGPTACRYTECNCTLALGPSISALRPAHSSSSADVSQYAYPPDPFGFSSRRQPVSAISNGTGPRSCCARTFALSSSDSNAVRTPPLTDRYSESTPLDSSRSVMTAPPCDPRPEVGGTVLQHRCPLGLSWPSAPAARKGQRHGPFSRSPPGSARHQRSATPATGRTARPG